MGVCCPPPRAGLADPTLSPSRRESQPAHIPGGIVNVGHVALIMMQTSNHYFSAQSASPCHQASTEGLFNAAFPPPFFLLFLNLTSDSGWEFMVGSFYYCFFFSPLFPPPPYQQQREKLPMKSVCQQSFLNRQTMEKQKRMLWAGCGISSTAAAALCPLQLPRSDLQLCEWPISSPKVCLHALLLGLEHLSCATVPSQHSPLPSLLPL